MQKTLVFLVGLLIFLSCEKEDPINEQTTSVEITNQTEIDEITLTVNDMMVREFYKMKVANTEGTFIFDYHRYRPIEATLIINGRHNLVYFKPSKSKYTYKLDTSGYLVFNDLIEEYINDPEVRSNVDCVSKKSIGQCIECIDEGIAEQSRILKEYHERGLDEIYYHEKKTDLFYSRYQNYANAALSRKYMFEFDENYTPIMDSLHLMPQKYGTYQSSESRTCLLYTSPSPRDLSTSRMPSSA